MELSNKKIGLALGSGGARGLVHVGVIKALVQRGHEISYISGASIGSCVGAMYAASKDIEKIEKCFLDQKWEVFKAFFDLSVRGGVIKGKKVDKLLREWIGVENFSELKIPFVAVASDLISGEEVRLSEGNVVEAVRASMAVPVLMKPVEIGDYLLVDAGIINPVPDDVAREMGADFVIAVNLDHRKNSDLPRKKYKSFQRVSLRSLNIVRHYLAEYSLKDADIVLKPDIEDPGILGLKSYRQAEKAKALIKLGEDLINARLDGVG